MTVTDLAGEGCPIQRLYEICVHLVGSDDDGGHGLLVLWSRGGQEWESCQGDVVLAAGQTTFIVAVWAQAVQKTQINNINILERSRQCTEVVSCT